MSKSLDDALSENAWSVSAIIFDLDDMLDDEGRPISERRADVVARVGVEMEMRKCPFGGIREDKWMNVSALTQITRYYKEVLAEMAAFRRQVADADVTWEDILAGVIDLLAAPTIYLLQQRSPQGPVPAQAAVGHKLAAGLFGVLRRLHERHALGTSIPVTVDKFLDLIDETEALVGASEACAGSPQMIRKTSVALLEGNSDDHIELDPLRLEIARCLALQVKLGIFWHLYDRVHLWPLMKGEFSAHLTPCNSFLKNKFKHAGNKLDALAPHRPNSTMLPDTLNTQLRQKLADALNDAADQHTLEEDLRTATELLNKPGSIVQYDGAIEPLAVNVANYLNTYRLFEDELSKMELELRGLLDFPSDTPIHLGSAVFPTSQSLYWYQTIVGCELGADRHLTGDSSRFRVATLKK